MSTSAALFHFDDVTMWVELTDGRTIGVPMAWFPRLLHAAPQQRAHHRISATGKRVNWEDLDADISGEGLLTETIKLRQGNGEQ